MIRNSGNSRVAKTTQSQKDPPLSQEGEKADKQHPKNDGRRHFCPSALRPHGLIHPWNESRQAVPGGPVTWQVPSAAQRHKQPQDETLPLSERWGLRGPALPTLPQQSCYSPQLERHHQAGQPHPKLWTEAEAGSLGPAQVWQQALAEAD